MLSFTIAHIVGDRAARKQSRRRADIPRAAEHALPWGRLAALRDRRRARHRRRVARRRGPGRPPRATPASAWIAAGFVVYVALPAACCTSRSRRPCARRSCSGRRALEYRNILVPVAPGRETEEAIDVACRLATERRARGRGDRRRRGAARAPARRGDARGEDEANELLDEARTVGDSYGVDVIGAARARPRAPAARSSARPTRGTARSSSWARRAGGTRAAPVFGGTTDYVLKHAPCRVMVVGARAGGVNSSTATATASSRSRSSSSASRCSS